MRSPLEDPFRYRPGGERKKIKGCGEEDKGSDPLIVWPGRQAGKVDG